MAADPHFKITATDDTKPAWDAFVRNSEAASAKLGGLGSGAERAFASLGGHLDSATKRVGALDSAFGGVHNRLAALAGAAGITALAGMVRGAIDAADSLNRLSITTGVSIESLSGLSTVAKLSDTSLDTVGGALQKLSLHMGEAATGSKDSQAAFAALGVSLTDSGGKLRSTDDVLVDVAKSLNEYEGQAGKSKIMNELLGRSYAEIAPFMAELADRGRSVALVTEEQAQAADRFNDTLTLVGIGVGQIATRVAGNMLPVLEDLANQFLSASSNGDTLRAVADGLTVVLKGTVAAGMIVAEVFSQVGRAIGGVTAAVVLALQGDFKASHAALSALGRDSLASMKDTWSGIQKVVEAGSGGAAKAVAASTNTQKKSGDELLAALNRLKGGHKDAADASAKAFESAVKRSEDYIKSLQSAAAQEGLSATQKKMVEAATRALEAPTADLKMRIMEAAQAWAQEAQAASDNAQEKERVAANLKTVADMIAKADEANRAALAGDEARLSTLKAENDAYGLTASAIANQYVAALKLQIAYTEASENAIKDELPLLRQRLGVAEAIAEQTDRKAQQGAERDVNAEEARLAMDGIRAQGKAWDDMWASVDRVAEQSFAKMFEEGANVFEDLEKTLMRTLVAALYKLVVKPFVIQIIADIAGVTGLSGWLGAAGAAGGGGGAGGGGVGGWLGMGSTVASGAGFAGSVASGYAAGTAFLGTGTAAAGYGSAAQLAAGAAGMGGVGTAIGAGYAAGAATGGIAGGVMGGAAAGFAAVPVAGWVALAALAAYSIFSSKEPSHARGTFTTQPTTTPASYFEDSKAYATGAFGRVGFADVGTEYFSGEVGKAFAVAVAKLDTTLATYLSPEQIGRVKGRLTDVGGESGQTVTEGVIAEFGPEVIRQRFNAVFDEIDPSLKRYIAAMDGTVEQIAAFGLALLSAHEQIESGAAERTFGAPVQLADFEPLAQGAENVVETFNRVASVFTATNNVALVLGKDMRSAFGEIGLASLDARQNLVDLAGGLENLNAQFGFFFEQFYSDAERQAYGAGLAQSALTAGFDDLHIAVPKTRDEFRGLVESCDLSTDSGRKLFEALMKLAPSMDAVADAADAAQASFDSYRKHFLGVGDETFAGEKIKKTFGADFKIPDNRQAFVNYVNGIDRSTAAGEKFYQMVISHEGDFDAYYTAVENSGNVAGAAANKINAAYDDLAKRQEFFAGQQADNSRALDSMTGSLDNLFDALDTDPIIRLTTLISVLQAQVANAREQLTHIDWGNPYGNLPQAAGFQDFIDQSETLLTTWQTKLAQITRLEQESPGHGAALAELEDWHFAQKQALYGAAYTAEGMALLEAAYQKKRADIMKQGTDQALQTDSAAVSAGIAARQKLADVMGKTLPAMSQAATDALIEVAGGLDNLTNSLTSYYQHYFSQEEQLANHQQHLAGVFGSLNETMPTTLAGFRALVEKYQGMDTAGAAAVGALLAVEGEFFDFAAATASAGETVATATEQVTTAVDELAQRQNFFAGQVAGNTQALDSMTGALGNLFDAADTDPIVRLTTQISVLQAQVANAREQLMHIDWGNPYGNLPQAAGFKDFIDQSETLLGVWQTKLTQITALEAQFPGHGAALAELEDWLFAQKQALYGAAYNAEAMALLEQAYGKKRADILAQAADAGLDEMARLRDGIKEYLDSLVLSSDLSPLTPQQRLEAAHEQYTETLLKARAYDTEALGKITQVADAYLREKRSYEASGADYIEVFDAVRVQLAQLAGLSSIAVYGQQPGQAVPGPAVVPVPPLNPESPTKADMAMLSAKVEALIATVQQLGQDQVRATVDNTRAVNAQTDTLTEEQRALIDWWRAWQQGQAAQVSR